MKYRTLGDRARAQSKVTLFIRYLVNSFVLAYKRFKHRDTIKRSEAYANEYRAAQGLKPIGVDDFCLGANRERT